MTWSWLVRVKWALFMKLCLVAATIAGVWGSSHCCSLWTLPHTVGGSQSSLPCNTSTLLSPLGLCCVKQALDSLLNTTRPEINVQKQEFSLFIAHSSAHWYALGRENQMHKLNIEWFSTYQFPSSVILSASLSPSTHTYLWSNKDKLKAWKICLTLFKA